MNRQSFEVHGATESAEATPWWSPRAHADRRPFLVARARIATTLRQLFADEDFIEIEPTCLQTSPGMEVHLVGFATELETPGGRRSLYLHASPEFACKKLLAAGEERLFALCRVFRNGDAGPLHLPEFTMLEWYRSREPLARIEADCLAILRAAADAAGGRLLAWRGGDCDPFAEPERLSVQDAFARYVDADLTATLGPDGGGDAAGLARIARRLGLRVAADDGWSDLFSKILSAYVEPRLGFGRPTILFDYPLPEAALARRSPRDPRFAERFELYCCGVEIANAFGELTDAAEQRRRWDVGRIERARIYGSAPPIDEEFLAALAHMPEASGCALGFDRLVALASGATRLDQVAWTPLPAAPSPDALAGAPEEDAPK